MDQKLYVTLLIVVVIAGLNGLNQGYNYDSGPVSGIGITGAQVSSFGNCVIEAGKVICSLDQTEYSSVRACRPLCKGGTSETPDPVTGPVARPDPVQGRTCQVGGIALVPSIRTKSNFCGTNGRLIAQKAAGQGCGADYECGSNVCRRGECVSKQGLFKEFCGSGLISGGCTCCTGENAECTGPWGHEICEVRLPSCSTERGRCTTTGDCCPRTSLNCVDSQCIRCANQNQRCGDDRPCCSEDFECNSNSVCVQKLPCPGQGDECSETLRCCPGRNLECGSVQGRQRCVACPGEGESCSQYNPCCSGSGIECVYGECRYPERRQQPVRFPVI